MLNPRVFRCVMFVPINNPRFTERAWTRGADAYILDLEDSVPQSEKEKARSLVKETIPVVSKGGAAIFVRVNHDYVESDLKGCVWPGLTRIILPKTETADDMKHCADILTVLEKERGIPVGSIEITPLIESALGAVNGYEIAAATPRGVSSHGGAGYDMAVDLGIEMFASFDQYAYTEAFPTLAQMAAGIEALGGVFVPNTGGRADSAEFAANLAGYIYRSHVYEATVLHPALVKPLVMGLTPKPEDVVWAKKVIDVYEKLVQDGESVTVVDGKTVDVYEYNMAQKLLDWNDKCIMKDAFKARAIAKAEAEEKAKG
jgi:citrate lyase subunit beta/citryl-CoA lyase